MNTTTSITNPLQLQPFSASQNQSTVERKGQSRRFNPTRTNNPCPLCTDVSGKCRTLDTGSIFLCMTYAGPFEFVPGFQFLGPTRDGLWGKWRREDERCINDQARETWRLQQRAIRQQQRLQQQRQQAESMPVAKRDRHYRQLLDELTLHDADRADLHRRGFSDAQIDAWGAKSVVAGQRLLKFYPKNLPGVLANGYSLVVAEDGYLCPVRDVQGRIQGMQLRVRGASDNKYRWLSSTKNSVNLPNGELPLAVFNPQHLIEGGAIACVEGTGAKPFLAAQRLGLPVIGAAGGQWASSIEQLQAIAQGQSLILVPDGGAIKNHHVMRQYAALAEQYPDLTVLWWNQVEKGADIDEISDEQLADAHLISWSDFEAIRHSIAGADVNTSVNVSRNSKQTIHLSPGRGSRLTRRPDLHIGTDEFKTHVEQFPTAGITALLGPQGSGKGEAIARMLKSSTWLSVTILRSLARDQAEGWNGVFINDGDVVSNHLIKNGQPVAGGSVCLPSLLKLRGYKPEVLILDELPTITDFLTSSKLCNKEGMRPLLIEELSRKIREASHVVVASADLREEGLQWIEQIRNEKTYLVQSSRLPLPWTCHIINDKQAWAIAEVLARVKTLRHDQLVTIHTDTRALANKISALLLEQACPNLLITADTSGGELEGSFLSSKGQDIPMLLMMGIRAIVTSPSVKEGFSIQHHADQIDSVWGIFEGCSITAESAAQTLNRVRSLAPRFVWIAEKGRAYSPLSHATSVGDFLKDLKRSSSAKVELVRRSLKTETLATALNINWHDQNLRLLADGEVRRNRGMKTFKNSILNSLKREGKIMANYRCQSDPDKVAQVSNRMEEIRTHLQMERAIALATAPNLTESQVQELERKQALTPEESMSLERYYLEQFYRIEAVTCDDVLWDKNGTRRKQIRNLEMVLNPEKAKREAALSIEQNTSTPQDWSRLLLQLDLLERCGLAALIHAICAGEIVDLDPVLMTAIAIYLRAHAEEFSLAFNFKNMHLVTDMQIIAHCFDWCGLKRVSYRMRSEGKVLRLYRIDQDNLATLKTIIERRSHLDPTQGISIENRKAGSTQVSASSDGLTSLSTAENSPKDLISSADNPPQALLLGKAPPNPGGRIVF